jgi:hypothetical protein
MTDLIERLRGKYLAPDHELLLWEAADELERLTAALDDHLHEALYQKQVKELQERIAELEKSIELSGTISNYAQETIESAQRKRIAELERVLQIHGVHVTECAKWDKMDSGQLFLRHDWPCSCGLEAALQEDDK